MKYNTYNKIPEFFKNIDFVFTQVVPINWKVLENYTNELFVNRREVSMLKSLNKDFTELAFRVFNDSDTDIISGGNIRLKRIDENRTVISTTSINDELKKYFQKILDDWAILNTNKAEQPTSILELLGQTKNNNDSYKTVNLKKEIVLQTKPAGAPVNKTNEEAWGIIKSEPDNLDIWKKAYEYWCRERGIKNPGRKERDLFKKSMKRAKERELGQIR